MYICEPDVFGTVRIYPFRDTPPNRFEATVDVLHGTRVRLNWAHSDIVKADWDTINAAMHEAFRIVRVNAERLAKEVTV